MKIKAGLMFAILMSFIWCSICKATSTEDEALGEAFARCAATMVVFIKSMPSLGLPPNTKEQDEKLNLIIGMHALANFALVGKEKAEVVLNNQLESEKLVAESAIKIGDSKTYITFAGQKIMQCMDLLETNKLMLKPKFEAIAEEQKKKANAEK